MMTDDDNDDSDDDFETYISISPAKGKLSTLSNRSPCPKNAGLAIVTTFEVAISIRIFLHCKSAGSENETV